MLLFGANDMGRKLAGLESKRYSKMLHQAQHLTITLQKKLEDHQKDNAM
jgi:hypothetical protein